MKIDITIEIFHFLIFPETWVDMSDQHLNMFEWINNEEEDT